MFPLCAVYKSYALLHSFPLFMASLEFVPQTPHGSFRISSQIYPLLLPVGDLIYHDWPLSPTSLFPPQGKKIDIISPLSLGVSCLWKICFPLGLKAF